MNKRQKPGWLSIASIVKTTYWARFLLNAYNQKHNTNYGGTAALGLINIKTVLELRLVINERSQRMVRLVVPLQSASCCSQNLQGTLLTSFLPSETTSGSSKLTPTRGQFAFSREHAEFKVQSIIAYIRRLLKTNPDTTFRDEYPDNQDIRFSPTVKLHIPQFHA